MERIKVNIDFLMRASPSLLYHCFTDPTDIVRWFCDEVDVDRDIYTFSWAGEGEEAQLTENIEDELIRFEWLDPDRDGEYLEFRISRVNMTNETMLQITDFCDEDEADETKGLWTAQINALRRATGLG